ARHGRAVGEPGPMGPVSGTGGLRPFRPHRGRYRLSARRGGEPGQGVPGGRGGTVSTPVTIRRHDYGAHEMVVLDHGVLRLTVAPGLGGRVLSVCPRARASQYS